MNLSSRAALLATFALWTHFAAGQSPTVPASAASPRAATPGTVATPTSSGETQPEEVNVASSARGAKAGGAKADDLLALIDESNGTSASLQPNLPTGASVTTIDLADSTDVTRVALEIGTQKGKLQLFAVDAEGNLAAVTDPARGGRLLSEFTLDGSRSMVSADLGNLSVKTLAVVWIPETPGTSLTVANVGVFTRTPPPAAAIQSTAATSSPVASAMVASQGNAAATPAPAATTAAAPAATATATPPPAASGTGQSASATAAQNSSSSAVTRTAATPAAQTTATALPPQTRPVSY